ncbi:MAG: hypothetical protein CMJ29_07045 [Phycisphaerae bacterium]|nr:hypothetical protein [Phycisphaerae bacterium]
MAKAAPDLTIGLGSRLGRWRSDSQDFTSFEGKNQPSDRLEACWGCFNGLTRGTLLHLGQVTERLKVPVC